MEAGDLVRPQQDTVTIMRLRSSLDMCSEELPILLELGQVGELIKHDYNFPYHVPSLMSLATTSSSQMPETIGYCLLQVSARRIQQDNPPTPILYSPLFKDSKNYWLV